MKFNYSIIYLLVFHLWQNGFRYVSLQKKTAGQFDVNEIEVRADDSGEHERAWKLFLNFSFRKTLVGDFLAYENRGKRFRQLHFFLNNSPWETFSLGKLLALLVRTFVAHDAA